MKFCANLSFMFTEASSILERYALAKEAGFKAVESGFPFGHSLEQVTQAKTSAGIEQVLLNLCTGICIYAASFYCNFINQKSYFSFNLINFH